MDLKEVKTVGIVGVGFMGGSLALALKDKYKNIEIIGYARSEKSFKRLKRFRGLDKVEKNLAEIAGQADILILATPVGVITDYLKELGAFLKSGAVIFDLGSTKEEISKAAWGFLPKKVSFVGCHPFCGSEKSGVEEARNNLYQDSLCFITSKNKASFLVERIWKRIGARVVRIRPAEHDKLLALISHFPHLICFSLVDMVPNKHLEFSSSGFRDLTRIASSSSDLWADIFLANKNKMLAAIDKHGEVLNRFRFAIEKKDKEKLKNLIKKANRKRNKIK